jgi:ferredoxin
VADVEVKWHVEIDGDICIGSGGCVNRAPEAFELDMFRQSCVKHALMAPSDAVLDAAETCPVEAISIREEETGRLVFPPEE